MGEKLNLKPWPPRPKKKNDTVYLIIEGYLPTTHISVRAAGHYVTFVRDTDKFHKNLQAMYTEYTLSDLKENFKKCKFKKL